MVTPVAVGRGRGRGSSRSNGWLASGDGDNVGHVGDVHSSVGLDHDVDVAPQRGCDDGGGKGRGDDGGSTHLELCIGFAKFLGDDGIPDPGWRTDL